MTDNEIKLQEKARDLVGREVIYCLSTLMYELREVAENLDDHDTYTELCYGTPDYEEAAWQATQEADASVLWEMLEHVDTVPELLVQWDIRPADEALARFAENEDVFEQQYDEDDEPAGWAHNDAVADTVLELIKTSPKASDLALENWRTDSGVLDGAHDEVLEDIRTALNAQIEDYQAFCQEFDIDTDDYQREVFEHWLVTEWLGRKLTEKGEVVREYMGLTIWARTTTGQAISIDGVIEEIVKELEK